MQLRPVRSAGARSALSALCVALVVLGEAADLGIGPPLPSDPRAVLGAAHGGFSSWLRDFRINIPNGTKISAGIGDAMVSNGSCWGVSIGAVDHTDLSSELTLEYVLRLSGVGATCRIYAELNGTLDISVDATNASLNATLQLQPFRPPGRPNTPLPFGNVTASACSAVFASSKVKFSGTSSLVGVVNLVDEELLLSLIAGQACSTVEEKVAEKGSWAMGLAAGLAPMLLSPPTPMPEPALLQEPIDWARYPPMTVLKNLVRERFSLWSQRAVQILSMNSFDAALVSTKTVSLELRQLRLEGVGGADAPGMSLVGENHTVGVDVDMPNLTASAVLLLNVALPEQPVLTEVLTLKVGLHNASLRTRALFDEDRLDHIVLDEVAKSRRCLVDCTDGITDPQKLSIAVTDIGVSLRPQFEVGAFGKVEKDIASLANSLMGSMFEGYMPSIGLLLNGGLGMSRGLINERIWGSIAEMPPCSEPGMLLGLNRGAIEALPVAAVVVLALGLVAAAVAHLRRGARRPSARDAAGASAAAAGEASAPTRSADAEEAPVPRAGSCLAREAVVPPALAVFYPFAVVAVMLLYWFADFALGAVVSLVMEADGRQTTIGPVFSFSLLSTIVDSMAAGSWAISILTLLMSGVWPHIKLSLLLAAWVVPPRRFSRKARERVLSFLDAWGKYGFLESWFMVFSMSAFAIAWESAGSNASIKVQTTPVVAFYAYFGSTVFTLILGHVASEYHAMAMASADTCGMCGCMAAQAPPDETLTDVAVGEPEANAERVQDASGESDASSSSMSTKDSVEEPRPLCLRVTRTMRIAVAAGLGASLMLAVLSAVLTSFEFTISGLFVEFLLAHPIDKQYSLLTVGEAVAEGRYGNIGLLFLEVCFFLLSFVIPLVLLVTLLFLWLMPLTERGQRKLLRAGHLLDAWACLDVAVLVLVIAIMQFGMMAEFLVSKGSLATPCRMIKSLAREDCLDIQMSARPGLAVLILAGLALLVVPKVAMNHCEHVLGRKSLSQKSLTTAPAIAKPAAES